MARRLIAAVVLAVLGLLAWGPRTASAHAGLISSEPASGALLQTSPANVVLTFTETPDLSLSTVHVVDGGGRNVERGKPQAVAGQARSLAVAVPELPRASYTVTWRTTSAEDGHSSAGAFAFGVGVQPSATAASGGTADPAPTSLSTAGKWLLYVGLALLLGGAAMFAIGGPGNRPTGQGLFGAWLMAALGGILIAADLVRVTGVGPIDLASTSTGRKVLVQLVVLAVTGVLAEFAARRASPRRVTFLAIGTAAVMFARVRAGHAAAASLPAFAIALQWIHLVAVGLWIGGLPWLVGALRRAEPGRRGDIALRFSRLATVALAAVLVTGTVRALDEVGSWSGLFDTGYGVSLLVKLGLVAAVLVLATLNRTRRRSGRLRVSAGLEAGVAAAVLGASAVLSGFTPAASLAASRPVMTRVVVNGNDFATTTRVRLVLSPGSAGVNRFDAEVTDYDTGEPIAARSVVVRLTPAGRTDVPPSTVELKRADDRWRADSPALSIEGPWRAVVVVETAAGGREVPLRFSTRQPPARITAQRTPGLPTIYTITVGSRHVQAYVDPGSEGGNQIHFTYVDATGAAVDVEAADIRARRAGQPENSLTPRKLDIGHYVADAELTAGRWTFVAVSADGLRVEFSESVRS